MDQASPSGRGTGRSFRVIGPGRAGGSFATALAGVGWVDLGHLGRVDDLRGAAAGVDLVLVATPDRDVAAAAAAIEPAADAVIVHLAGSLGLHELATHPHRGALHPLMSLPSAAVGARRLRSGTWFAVDGNDEEARAMLDGIVDDFDGHGFHVSDADRVRYHAAACIASNHLVALMAQVERVAEPLGIPFEALLGLAASTLENVTEVGTVAALTGPVARADWATVAGHMDVLDSLDQRAYVAMAAEAWRLVAADPDNMPEMLDEVMSAGAHFPIDFGVEPDDLPTS